MESEAAEGRSATQSERPDRTFELDGEKYELPLAGDLNLDEERILYVYADVVIQDLMPIHPDLDPGERMVEVALQLRRFRNPDLKRAVAHIAYRRRHPDVSDEDVEKALGKVNALALDIAMFAEAGADPTKTSQTSSSSERSESEPTAQSSSGRHTESTSPSPVLTLASTGTSESATSSPLSDQAIPV